MTGVVRWPHPGPARADDGPRPGRAGPSADAGAAGDEGPGEALLPIFLGRDETKTVDEINQHLKATGWFRDFPPPGVEVISWCVMMGVGQVVTLRFPARRLREINRQVEGEAWGSHWTEFYPTYDYRALYEQLRATMRWPGAGA